MIVRRLVNELGHFQNYQKLIFQRKSKYETHITNNKIATPIEFQRFILKPLELF